ncbi:uncharacterized protein TrAtP1_002017 [Trichoderma atroviride]|uniref:uncharacterized protein n=1 Tax=Hypocrea atroviridis TaxID=63577 RepID=UPI0033321C25|nr:hypothetical protein TrAtP1_002017 [Trichoderma atroviride]
MGGKRDQVFASPPRHLTQRQLTQTIKARSTYFRTWYLSFQVKYDGRDSAEPATGAVPPVLRYLGNWVASSLGTARTLNPSLSDLRAYDPARLAGTIGRKTDGNGRQMRSAVGRVCSVFVLFFFGEAKLRPIPGNGVRLAGERLGTSG